jgi:4-carboxymuconolactone decarboxylase
MNNLFECGLALRRQVLGPEGVRCWDRNMSTDHQDRQRLHDGVPAHRDGMVLGLCVGRPGLDLKTRSLLNLAMLTALNRAAEVKLRVRGAINNGVTVDEIKEVLLHATVYCGIPAGLDAFKAANEVLKEMGKLPTTGAG